MPEYIRRFALTESCIWGRKAPKLLTGSLTRFADAWAVAFGIPLPNRRVSLLARALIPTTSCTGMELYDVGRERIRLA